MCRMPARRTRTESCLTHCPADASGFIFGDPMSFLFSKKAKKEPTRLFFATDLHGSERTFRKFINAGKFYDVNVMVMGGDIQGQVDDPHHQGRQWASSRHRAGTHRTSGDRRRIESPDGQTGYPRLLLQGHGGGRIPACKPTRRCACCSTNLQRQKLINWVNLAEERLNGTGIKVLCHWRQRR
jgi:uncharacterized protein